MSITPEQKKEVIAEYSVHENDTGSCQVQIAVLTTRIKNLTEHFKGHHKDHHSRRGLIRLVNLRRRLLDYLKRKNNDEYKRMIAALGIRK